MHPSSSSHFPDPGPQFPGLLCHAFADCDLGLLVLDSAKWSNEAFAQNVQKFSPREPARSKGRAKALEGLSQSRFKAAFIPSTPSRVPDFLGTSRLIWTGNVA